MQQEKIVSVKRVDLPSVQHISHNPAGWPAEVLPLFERAYTCEFATLTRTGIPITQPLTPYIGDDELTLDVSTGLTYPAKAERARRNPKVALLYSDSVGTNLDDAPVVLVYALAAVRDADLQANTDRYLKLSLAKAPAGFKGTPGFVLSRLPWYFARIWIETLPLRILWWPQGQMDQPPLRWEAPADLQIRPSDPVPGGKQPLPWKKTPISWQDTALYAVTKLGLPVITTVDADGFPVPLRVRSVSLTNDGFRLHMPAGAPLLEEGSACLTFHSHPKVFSGQENKAFLGYAQYDSGNEVHFNVERPLADWSLQGSRLSAAVEFFRNGRTLAPRVKAEAARRGQPVPTLHIPSFW